MKWTKYRLKITTQAVDLVSGMLYDLGISGIEVEDRIPITEDEKKQMFIDILPEQEVDDGTAVITFYAEIDQNPEEIVFAVKEGLQEITRYVAVGEGSITVSETEDKDWINNWKAFFKPFRVDDTIVIKPTWEQADDVTSTDIVIEIDPGTAFGTGSHETTKLCIVNLKRHLKPNMQVLDVGCGSGILSVIAQKLGAAYVAGTDVDCIAVNTSIENAGVNGLCAKIAAPDASLQKQSGIIEFMTGDLISSEQMRRNLGLNSYDLVVANILADIIIPLSGVVRELMKPGALLISSGIISGKQEAVCNALRENGFEIVDINKIGDWVSIVAR